MAAKLATPKAVGVGKQKVDKKKKRCWICRTMPQRQMHRVVRLRKKHFSFHILRLAN